MTALYCYMVSFYNYSDSEFLPIFHERKFTKKEFQDISNEIKQKIKDMIESERTEIGKMTLRQLWRQIQ